MTKKPMIVESTVAKKVDRNTGTALNWLVAMVAVITLSLASAVAISGGSGPSAGKKSDAVKFESIPGTTVKRVILSAKAAERLGIETGKVSKETIIRKQVVGGRIVPLVAPQPSRMRNLGGFGGFQEVTYKSAPRSVAMSTIEDGLAVLVTLSKGEWDRLDKDKPARLMSLETREALGKEALALPSGQPPLEDRKRSMLKIYYNVLGEDHGLSLYHRVRVELELSGSGEKRRVVPYSAVYYDAEGTAWVYTNPKPLVYERKRIEIERIVGDLAVVTESPSIGTAVVTVGAGLLYGAEVVFGK